MTNQPDTAQIENPFQKFTRCVRADMRRYFGTGFRKAEKSINKPKIVFETLVFKAGFHATLTYRISHLFYRMGLPWIAWLIQRWNVTFCGAEIEYNSEIGEGLLITHPVGIVVGRGTRMGKNCMLYQNVTLGARYLDPQRIFQFPVIDDNVIIFSGAVIAGRVRVGANSIIGANAVVLDDVPANSTAAGIPAKVLNKKGAKP